MNKKIAYIASWGGYVLSEDKQRITEIKVGQKVSVPTLFGRRNMVVVEVDGDSAKAETQGENGMGAWLSLGEDKYWNSSSSYNKDVVVKIALV